MKRKLKHVVLRLDQFGPALQTECLVPGPEEHPDEVDEGELIREVLRAFSKHAPCTVRAFIGERPCAVVELTITGRVLP